MPKAKSYTISIHILTDDAEHYHWELRDAVGGLITDSTRHGHGGAFVSFYAAQERACKEASRMMQVYWRNGDLPAAFPVGALLPQP